MKQRRSKKKLSSKGEDRAIIIPELPPIPPDGILTVVLYGKTTFRPEVSLAASGVSTKIETLTKIKDSWFVSLYNDPLPLLGFAPALSFVLFLLYFAIKAKVTIQSDDGDDTEDVIKPVTDAEEIASEGKQPLQIAVAEEPHERDKDIKNAEAPTTRHQ